MIATPQLHGPVIFAYTSDEYYNSVPLPVISTYTFDNAFKRNPASCSDISTSDILYKVTDVR